MNSNSEIEEERRLCYVAITRAKTKLYITNARTRVLYGQEQVNIVSRFVNEMDNDLIDIINKDDQKEIKINEPKKVLLDDSLCDYKPNDYVYHDIFGTGKVISVEKSIIKIAFKMPYGIKTLMKNHSSLHKIDE
jgi:DNA helicase-2/ATP-dependent DNA helicase PcrA